MSEPCPHCGDSLIGGWCQNPHICDYNKTRRELDQARQAIERGQWTVQFTRLATDQKTVAERKWQSGLKPAKAQLPADIGLFGDTMNQLELDVEMFMEPEE